MSITNIRQSYRDMPAGIKYFLKRALLLTAGWLLVYHLFLLPKRIIDRPLTNLTAYISSGLVTKYVEPTYTKEEADKVVIYESGTDRHLTGIADACNALDLYVLYLGFLLCIPAGKKNLLLFSTIGLLVIFVLNIFRSFVLAWLAISRPEYFDFAHHYVFYILIYGVIFLGWIWYGKKAKLEKES